MGNDVTWWKRPEESPRNQEPRDTETEVPGDTDAADIVGRTGEEMPDAAHDEGRADESDDPLSMPDDCR